MWVNVPLRFNYSFTSISVKSLWQNVVTAVYLPHRFRLIKSLYIKCEYLYIPAVGVNSGILNSLMFATTMQLFDFQRGRHVWGYINVMLALGMYSRCTGKHVIIKID